MVDLDQLNPRQKEAVSCTEGPLLILAGAGSGKTRVLTYRIAYLIEEKHVDPWNIMAITFTNKAAGEMKDRVERQVEDVGSSIWVTTFHSTCVRILRRYIECLGYQTNFSIYDTDDQKALMKQVIRNMNLDPKMFKEKTLLNKISQAKDKLISPEEFIRDAGDDYASGKIGEVYLEYQKALKKNNALDFDDLIFKTVELFTEQPEILEYYQNRFRYIMVDEYQDTNLAQFRLVYLLASKYKNICVVGDDDQSIYRFRGADIGNILNFEDSFPGAKVIKLEQNYRSTQTILDVANNVIRHNKGRKDKKMWTANGEGEKIRYRQFEQAYDEARFIIDDIIDRDLPYEDCAVLYRTNAQSRLLEEACIASNVPYRLIGGVNFYQRKEIKDVLAYLKTIANGLDDLAVARVINVPKRGIGAASVAKVTQYAYDNGLSLYDAMAEASKVPDIGRAAEKIAKFTDLIEDFRSRLKDEDYTIQDLINDVLDETGYRQELEEEDDAEGDSRLENIEELINKAVSYQDEAEEPTLDGFLEEVALVADVDQLDQAESRVTLMTLHSAKGLEFENVYLSGMEDGLFPSFMAISSDDDTEIEEERRLCYVGITRAKKDLTLTGSKIRMVNGETRYFKNSRFIDEIPEELIESERLEPKLDSGNGRKKLEEMTKNVYDSGRGKVSSFAKNDNAYASKTSSYGSNPGFGRTFTVEKSKNLDYKVGDRVLHAKFGVGTVEDIKDGPKDYEVTVCFDSVGVKKMFASFAKLKKA